MMGSVSNSNPWASPNSVFKDCSQGICSVYCPQWCYIIYSPPPPSFLLGGEDNGNDDDNSGFQFSPLIVAVIGILASTFILVTYYTVISRFCRHRGGRISDPSSEPMDRDGGEINESAQAAPNSSSYGLDEALIKSIRVCKYVKGGGGGAVAIEGSDCSVCLSEFQENESLRLLPKCNHAFHLPCIDTWLRSHSSCPLCRSVINSSPNQKDAAALMEAPAPASFSINPLEYQHRNDDVVVVIQSSPLLLLQQQQVVVDLGNQEKWPGECADNGVHREQNELNLGQRRVSVADILNRSEADG